MQDTVSRAIHPAGKWGGLGSGGVGVIRKFFFSKYRKFFGFGCGALQNRPEHLDKVLWASSPCKAHARKNRKHRNLVKRICLRKTCLEQFELVTWSNLFALSRRFPLAWLGQGGVSPPSKNIHQWNDHFTDSRPESIFSDPEKSASGMETPILGVASLDSDLELTISECKMMVLGPEIIVLILTFEWQNHHFRSWNGCFGPYRGTKIEKLENERVWEAKSPSLRLLSDLALRTAVMNEKAEELAQPRPEHKPVEELTKAQQAFKDHRRDEKKRSKLIQSSQSVCLFFCFLSLLVLFCLFWCIREILELVLTTWMLELVRTGDHPPWSGFLFAAYWMAVETAIWQHVQRLSDSCWTAVELPSDGPFRHWMSVRNPLGNHWRFVWWLTDGWPMAIQ